MRKEFEVKVWEGFWSIDDCRDNRNSLFIFGDNIQRIGCGGQAIIRDEVNAMGLVTKVLPKDTYASYMNDHEYWHNIVNIDIDLAEIIHTLISENPYNTLILSSGGYGTGLAKLPEKAPETYKYLCKRLLDLFGFDNNTGKLVQ
jgi:hypothetical protein